MSNNYYGGGNSSNGQDGGSYYDQSGGYSQQQQQDQQQQQQQPGYSSGGYASQNNQQWQQPQYSQQQAQQPGQPQPYAARQQQQFSANQGQTAAAPVNFWNPATAATVTALAGSMASTGFSNDAMLDLASSAGKSFLQNGSARMVPGLESTMLALRSYYAVDNKYVVRKMQKVLVPFLSKNWRRELKDVGGPDMGPEYDLPTIDENAPDLYLPCMCLVTYVLLCALGYGTAGKFDPEVIPDVTTKCMVTQILEVLIIRFGLYMMQAPVPFLDLFSYTGYKYLGLCINMLVGMMLGHFGFGMRGYYVTFIWTASAASFFMLKTMANNIPLATAATGPKREVMVVAFAASQFASMWFVSQTKNL